VKYGLALDDLRAADLMMTDGRVLRAGADDDADLFRAVRDGGELRDRRPRCRRAFTTDS
jgi:FAD/FMN-containing dehydrogenase